MCSLLKPQALHTLVDHAQARACLSEHNGGMRARWRNYTLHSHFQPIVSFSHRTIVGHEALVRASDESGQPIPPPVLLQQAQSTDALIGLDRLCRLLHIHNAQRLGLAGYLFLNMHPLALAHLPMSGAAEFMQATLAETGIDVRRLIIEVTEDVIHDDSTFEASVAFLHELGCRVALDDFGAGHSNFDRVWRLRPYVVKLDRSFAVAAASGERERRLLPQIVELLHEAGSLVLLEGIETGEQGHIAMSADIDYAQGYHFGRPLARPEPDAGIIAAIDEVWARYDTTQADDSRQYRERLAPYIQAIQEAAILLGAGCETSIAIAPFLRKPRSMRCYVLDEHGYQIGRNVAARAAEDQQIAVPGFDASRSRWSRRPYFRRAVDNPGELCVTRPYLCITSARLCLTLSISYRHKGQLRVLCGDIDWS